MAKSSTWRAGPYYNSSESAISTFPCLSPVLIEIVSNIIREYAQERLGEVSCLNDNTLGLMSCRHHVAAEIIEVSREQNLIVPAYRYVGARRTIINSTADGTLEK